MHTVLVGIFALSVLFGTIKCFQQSPKLIGTHIVYRHGDRAPFYTYPTSTNSLSFWPNGRGQLTPRGQLQHVRLGKYLRERYSELLNTTYVASEVTIRSTDYERTLMSAYSNLVGLYPTSKEKLDSILSELGEEDKWPETMPWQPIPVHTVPQTTDYLMSVSDCPRYYEFFEELYSSEKVQSVVSQYQDFFKQLEIWTGSKIGSVFDAMSIADTVIIESLYNVQPSWANASVLAQLRDIYDLPYYRFMDSFEMNRILAGPMVREIMENIQNLIGKNSNARKAKIYSGNDITLSGLLSFFGSSSPQPPYCATLFFDLYHIPEHNTYAVKLEYLNSTNGRTPKPIVLPPCSNALCPIEVLSKWLDGRIISNDMANECMPQKSKGLHMLL